MLKVRQADVSVVLEQPSAESTAGKTTPASPACHPSFALPCRQSWYARMSFVHYYRCAVARMGLLQQPILHWQSARPDPDHNSVA
jgi:hypothetical protein